MRAPLGMSIGYRCQKDVIEERGGQWMRRIQQLYLGEYSYVGMPMHPMAGVTAVKSQDTETLTGAALALKSAASKLDELAGQAVLDQKAMAQLGLDTKDGMAFRPALAHQVKSVTDQLIAMFLVNPDTAEDLTLADAASGDGTPDAIDNTADGTADEDHKSDEVVDLDAYRARLGLI
jgi:hypothetical protein